MRFWKYLYLQDTSIPGIYGSKWEKKAYSILPYPALIAPLQPMIC